MDRILYINKVTDTRIREMVSSIGDSNHDYSKDYLTFEAIGDTTFKINIPASRVRMSSISYSLDDGKTWTTRNLSTTTLTIGPSKTFHQGEKILWKGLGTSLGSTSANSSSKFQTTGEYKVYGNIMSLLYGDNFLDKYLLEDTPSYYTFGFLFLGLGNNLVSVEDLILPATTLGHSCYISMFSNCTAITKAPVLPARTLKAHCYNYMFSNCSNLSYVKIYADSTHAIYNNAYVSAVDNWLSGAAPSGTLVIQPSSGIRPPSGWTVEAINEE